MQIYSETREKAFIYMDSIQLRDPSMFERRLSHDFPSKLKHNKVMKSVKSGGVAVFAQHEGGSGEKICALEHQLFLFQRAREDRERNRLGDR